MNGAATRAISTRMVDALPAGRAAEFRDRDLPAFGIAVDASGAKAYFVEVRGERIPLGPHGAVSAGRARRLAASALARGAGETEAAPPPTLAELANRYMREFVLARCKPATVAQYRLTLENHLLPALGDLPVASIGPGHVAELQLRLGDRPAAANLAVSTLARLIEHAADRGLVPAAGNPCRFARKYRVRRRERFLTESEFRRLGAALDSLETEAGISAHAAAAIRLLMLTGCRRNEILTLRWEDVHPAAGELRLRDSKTGPRAVPLSPAASAVFAGIPRLPGNPWVFPGRKPGARLSGVFGPWCRARERAGLEDLRIHDLRHSFASRALALGESLPTIARLLGHAQVQTTARYAHLARDAVREAAARVAAGIGEDILQPAPPPAPSGSAARQPDPAPGAAVKASAARIAAAIGEDLLPTGRDAAPCPEPTKTVSSNAR